METPYTADIAVLTQLTEADGLYDGAKMHIATAAPSPLNPNMAVADFTQASFTGSDAKVIVWGTAYNGPDGVPQVDTQLLTFTVTATSPGSNVVGWYLTDGAGTALLAADIFDAPINVPGLGSGFSFVVAIRRYDGITKVVEL
jgi:hypothetical protein